MNDDQLLRYSRQIMLPQVEVAGQQRIMDAHALIIGAGGLGAPVALYLAAAGVGTLTIADADIVELSNLQRQIIHRTADIGRPKVVSAAEKLAAVNPEVKVNTVQAAMEGEALDVAVRDASIVLDCTDNFTTRFAVNAACVRHRKPLISAAVIRFEGQLTVFDPAEPDSPCYRCLYKDGEELAERCSQTGVLASLPGVMGSLQATEALKHIIGLPTLRGRLLVMDAMTMEWRSMKLRKDPSCPVCG
ncbi:UBA/ThiF-type NAD/FAD binding fold protein [Thioalkalivibrio sulfidiphilus HL-EbGr7]|uniref:UBA/ThiF-type NAD/FAD binding fold protein n=1 Tax=Thioalkalivibrio sulfidiphilus (strain HL-EbGR7) TaxID=396588 RepID=B8GL98_THISH|nr:molybdopterin-synthase adenylyltransferase MoeB [Thioalkalivibrio sulfidiphilus]ACL71616.1 UBA/ThiF-type NAD/FAD binding fold protein [Thioalkalivibrio sulfidiphilus HL-EbGr7]